ncbi:hypothetical protein ACIQZB_40545 [Streptomyces sp. NPDC097727]|uniref:hypothetical protein n=1 Tax=Streptomyces sp. NPDC097727 TaxID=3366092 RepID=UPI0037FDA3BF
MHRTRTLGDSYASAPLVPDRVDTDCLRSSNNYPSLVAPSSGATLTDVTCSGATTAEMTAAQGAVASARSVRVHRRAVARELRPAEPGGPAAPPESAMATSVGQVVAHRR